MSGCSFQHLLGEDSSIKRVISVQNNNNNNNNNNNPEFLDREFLVPPTDIISACVVSMKAARFL